jgi:hypothetical protein
VALQKYYQTLLKLVISDCAHFEATQASQQADSDSFSEISDLDDYDEEADDMAEIDAAAAVDDAEQEAEDLIDKYAKSEDVNAVAVAVNGDQQCLQ